VQVINWLGSSAYHRQAKPFARRGAREHTGTHLNLDGCANLGVEEIQAVFVRLALLLTPKRGLDLTSAIIPC
jgi:hypothetical protein